MTYKYQRQISQLNNCPPQKCVRKDMEAFRFVFKDINREENFLPPFVKNPRRMVSSGIDNEKRCDGHGLSFFVSLEKAKTFYARLKQSYPNIHQSLGSHVARGVICKSDGVITLIQDNGHFTLHEFEGVDFKDRFQIVAEVHDETD